MRRAFVDWHRARGVCWVRLGDWFLIALELRSTRYFVARHIDALPAPTSSGVTVLGWWVTVSRHPGRG